MEIPEIGSGENESRTRCGAICHAAWILERPSGTHQLYHIRKATGLFHALAVIVLKQIKLLGQEMCFNEHYSARKVFSSIFLNVAVQAFVVKN